MISDSSVDVELDRLSLRARLGMALVCFEHYCRRANIKGRAIDNFLDWMWEPTYVKLIEADFDDWESRQPALVEIGLGWDVEGFEHPADSSEVSEYRRNRFHHLLCNVTEILYAGLYHMPNRQSSLEHLSLTLEIGAEEGIHPCISVFTDSTWEEGGSGWGNVLSYSKAMEWRHSEVEQ